MRSFCRKKQFFHKIPRFRGGEYFGFWGGGRCRFYFYGRGDFSAKGPVQNGLVRTRFMAHMWFMHDAHLGRAFLFLETLAEYALLSMTVMVTPCLKYVVGTFCTRLCKA